jgi:hypothetical protein
VKRRVQSQILAMLLGGLTPCMALDPGCEAETATVKGEVKILSPEVTGVKVDVHFGGNSGAAASPPGMDERAGQRGATEYEGRPLKCRDDGSGTKTCW